MAQNENFHKMERHVVLVAPEIHWNTGNIGRTCLATDSFLHLVKPLGFSLESRNVKRAGLDYWKDVKLTVWDDFSCFLSAMAPSDKEMAVFSKNGQKPLWEMPTADRFFLVFGSETKGLPLDMLNRYRHDTFHIPISAKTRSLNLSTAVGIALYESLRAAPSFHAWP